MILATVISSCSSEENDVISADTKNTNKSLIKSQKISRDANGRYTIDYTLADNAQANLVKDTETNSNNIHAFESNGTIANRKTNNSNLLELEDNKIKVGVFQNGKVRNSITVEDENIILAKGEVNTNFLQTYSVESFGDGQYLLEFTVREGVVVDFKYNADENIYEVHLKEGIANQTSYTKLYRKSESLSLKIDFVNHIRSNIMSRGEEGIAYIKSRRPKYDSENTFY